ncbi:MJ1477/TM1410 family putative glycoside hydrolase [Devosia rhizoryzae]|uniref:Endo alpha-1,4 polygalactosaminidase n=1 Tax=Devosia rhizoryzae TaxID=2774137 RepID=A0ABX7CER2_9HYPH|nr:MJ1477/TM1410 family putative glycoside hydrolase [Devosia rhizoryzae]QQR40406.1 endo alpha-1,4 polygalactosaminidase [Devosia rhizoryzae]
MEAKDGPCADTSAGIMLEGGNTKTYHGERFCLPLLSSALVLQIALAIAATPALSAPLRTDLSAVRSWGYQLQQVNPQEVAASPYDLMVVDYSRDGSEERSFTAADVAAMKRQPDGHRRFVIAYLSIGEAEDYRFYWQRQWNAESPSWLGAENPDWQGNYAIRYWLPDWQNIIFGGANSYLDAIIDAGFDGVYLDRIDAFDVAEPGYGRAERMAAMSAFVESLASYARNKRPGFVVIGQNAEELLADDSYAQTLDAVGKEDLFFGLEGDGARNSNAELRASLTLLQDFQRTGKPVFVVEYLNTAESKTLARAQATALGAPLFIANRELDDVRSR